MTAILRLQEMTSSLTPPLSDRSECEDTTMLNSESFFPESFYPSPAPSLCQQYPAFIAPSPDMGQSDSVYDTEEEMHRSFLMDQVSSLPFTQSSISHSVGIYAPTMPYPAYEQSSWLPYSSFPMQATGHVYAGSETYSPYSQQQVPNSIIPPVPQTITGASFNFNEPVRTQETKSLLSSISTHNPRHSPASRSVTSMSEMSSYSRSPGPVNYPSNTSHEISRPSLLLPRSSSSSLNAYGVAIQSPGSSNVQAWRCAFPSCTSRAVFTRGCDLRKHYNRHSKHLFCRIEGCPQSESACITAAQQTAVQADRSPGDHSKLIVAGGFSSKKDRARHEAKHNPGIRCEWQGPNGEDCGRLFSRMDNMKDHMRRIHNKGQALAPQHTARRTKSRSPS